MTVAGNVMKDKTCWILTALWCILCLILLPFAMLFLYIDNLRCRKRLDKS